MSLDQHLLDQARSKFKKIFYKNTLIYFPYQGESLRNSNVLSPRTAIILWLDNIYSSLFIDEYLVYGISSTYSISFFPWYCLFLFPRVLVTKASDFYQRIAPRRMPASWVVWNRIWRRIRTWGTSLAAPQSLWDVRIVPGRTLLTFQREGRQHRSNNKYLNLKSEKSPNKKTAGFFFF